jgi:hypothetical protein
MSQTRHDPRLQLMSEMQNFVEHLKARARAGEFPEWLIVDTLLISTALQSRNYGWDVHDMSERFGRYMMTIGPVLPSVL